MATNSAQGNITIKRLRNGDSLFITFENNGIPLYQGVNPTTGEIAPKWTDTPANQPQITPKVTSAMGNSVTRTEHVWLYNGSQLLFTGDTSGDWRTDSTGRFQMNVGTTSSAGALKIIKDLANKDAVANGQLTYKCNVAVSGTNYAISKSIDVVIQNIGASSYYGAVLASPAVLDSETTTSTLTTSLMCGANAVDSYYVKWYKDTDLISDNNGKTSITVGRADIDGSQLFIAEFYLSSTDTTPVARAGVYIVDSLDEFNIVFTYTSSNTEVAPNKSVTVEAKVINVRTNAVVSTSSTTWACYIMDKDSWTVIGSSATNSITVTTEHTDRNGKYNDVEVVGEATFDI